MRKLLGTAVLIAIVIAVVGGAQLVHRAEERQG